jgi:hypothetical protein
MLAIHQVEETSSRCGRQGKHEHFFKNGEEIKRVG